MKLRTTQNSVRIRIRKSELMTLALSGEIAESVPFLGGAVFRFGLSISQRHEKVEAVFEAGFLKVILPDTIAQEWMNTNQVGIEVWDDLENGEHLHLLIEKDFPCVDRANEDKKDTFWELAGDKGNNC